MPENYTMKRRLAIYSGFAGSGIGQVPHFPINEALVTAAERQAKAHIEWHQKRLAYFRRIVKVAIADQRDLRRKAAMNNSPNGSAV